LNRKKSVRRESRSRVARTTQLSSSPRREYVEARRIEDGGTTKVVGKRDKGSEGTSFEEQEKPVARHLEREKER